MNFITSKKWLLLLAATAATLGIAGCGSDGGGSTVGTTTYAVTVESDGANPAGAGNYSAGAVVNIKAGTPPTADQKFGYWTASSNEVIFAHADSAATTFTMPAKAVTVTANFVPVGTTTEFAVIVESPGINYNGGGDYSVGETVTIRAGIPLPGQMFVNWTTTSNGVNFAHADSATTTFAMPANAVTVTANFVPIGPTQYAVTIVSLGTNPTGAGNYSGGDTVTIKAGTPPTGQEFKNWTTSSNGVNFAHADSAATTFIMPANIVTVTALFAPTGGDPTQLFTVNVNGNPTQGGSVNIGSQENVSAGTQLPITATANDGWKFDGWTMNPPTPSIINNTDSASAILTVNGNVTVTANFKETSYLVKVTRNYNRGGTIYVNGSEYLSNIRFDKNTEVTISASPSRNYKFVNWTGILPAGVNDAAKDTIKFTLTGDVDIQANFANSDNEGAGTIFYGGRTYKTVKIDNRTWMAENLNYEPDGTGTSWCYGDDPSNCEEYGRLYDWNTAKEVCPSGWELPSRSDWGNLAKFAGGSGTYGETSGGATYLKSSGGWKPSPGITQASDDFYFSGLPAGVYYGLQGGFMGGGGEWAMWWTATETSSVVAYTRSLSYDSNKIDEFATNKSYGLSVRCVSMD